MKKVLAVVLAALCCIGGSAAAADLPAKAKRRDVTPPLPFQYPVTGPYAFFGTEGGAGSANVTVPGLNSNSITTTTIDAHVGVGYVWSVPGTAMFYGCQARAGWQNFNGNTQGFSFSGPLALEQSCYFGIPWAQLSTLLPINFPPPPPFTPPTGVTITGAQWYFGATLDERDVSLNFGDVANKDWAIAGGVKIGLINQLSNGIAADTYAKIRFDSLGACLGPSIIGGACAKLGTSYLGGIDFKFGI